MFPETLPLRHASRELVRELGFLRNDDVATRLSHSDCHALIEIERRENLAQSELAALLRLDKSTTSRIITDLESRGWVQRRGGDDARTRRLGLTAKGRAKVTAIHREANGRVERALETLTERQRQLVANGMDLYARALERSRRRVAYRIRRAKPADRSAIEKLIRTVMPEFGAKGPGFAIQDPEVMDMPAAYRAERSAYFVVVAGDRVVGGGGFAPLVGGDADTCELRKMYFLPEVRGLGLGQEMLDTCLRGATEAGFRTMYLETLRQMTQAQTLYRRNGFKPLAHPMGNTGHFGCNSFFARPLIETKTGRQAPRSRSRRDRA